MKKALDYVKRCQKPNSGGFSYQINGFSGPNYGLTGAGLTSLYRLGVKDGAAIKDGIQYLENKKPQKEPDFHYYYGIYYVANAMWCSGEKNFQIWYPGIRDELLRNQTVSDNWEQGKNMSPHYCTAMALIVLQMPHGHMQSLKR